MNWITFLALCFAGLLVLGGIGLFLAIVTFRVGWDDGGPPDVHGDVPHVPDEARK